MIIIQTSIINITTLVSRRVTGEDDEEEERQSFYVRLKEKPLAKNDSVQYEHLHVVGRRRRVARTNKGGISKEQALRHGTILTMQQTRMSLGQVGRSNIMFHMRNFKWNWLNQWSILECAKFKLQWNINTLMIIAFPSKLFRSKSFPVSHQLISGHQISSSSSDYLFCPLVSLTLSPDHQWSPNFSLPLTHFAHPNHFFNHVVRAAPILST